MKGKVALVTGASRGLGKGVATYFGELGCSVICTARNRELLEATAQAIRAQGGSAVAIPADLTRQTEVESLVQTAMERFGTVHILVNCAGTLGPRMDLVEYLNEQDWDESLGVNLKSVFLTCRSVVPLMKKQRRGKIINLTTNIDDRVERGLSHYYAAKAGVTYFTRQLACEAKHFNIQVNCLNPGGLKTEMTKFWEEYADKDELRRIGETQYVPFQDRLREVGELLPLFRFLASSDSDALTGMYFSISSKVEPMYLSL
jgi:3-oxoacyl-[acyl-carrier protein] reductase